MFQLRIYYQPNNSFDDYDVMQRYGHTFISEGSADEHYIRFLPAARTEHILRCFTVLDEVGLMPQIKVVDI